MLPLFVNGLPRSGTTILMHSLASHPHIVAHEDYPYETRYAVWVWQNFKVLSQPQTQRGHHWSFQHHEDYAEKNPFYVKKDLREYFDTDYVNFIRNYAKAQVDHYYTYLAQRYNKENSKYFLEKFPGISENFIRLQYEKYKSVYILRNPIDVYISMRRMNMKRGRVDFEEDKFEQPQDHIKSLIKRSVNALKKYTKDDDVYVVKYEDFVSCPKNILESIFAFLEFEVNEEILSSGETRARDRSFSQKHSTSSSADLADVKQELNPVVDEDILASVIKDCGKDLGFLGYDIEVNKYLQKAS